MFRSILWQKEEMEFSETCQPDFFHDLNLSQLLERIKRYNPRLNLEIFYFSRCKDLYTIRYRQEVSKELQKGVILKCVKEFIHVMNAINEFNKIKEKLHDYQRELGILDASIQYVRSVESFKNALSGVELTSSGFKALRAYLLSYTSSEYFLNLKNNSNSVEEKIEGIRYDMSIGVDRVTVTPESGRAPYDGIVSDVFNKFRDGNYNIKQETFHGTGLTQVEASVLKLLSKMFPVEFEELLSFSKKYSNFIDPTIERFFLEVQFYLSYLSFIYPLEKTGLNFCIPEMDDGQQVLIKEGFDIVLASNLINEGKLIVTNDICLKKGERIVVITGPNSGGKTTFARSFGQIHYLASLGLPVPGIKARIPVFDQLYTHFETPEHPDKMMGKLESELKELRTILDSISSRSIVILNELLSSTSLKDATLIGTEVLKALDRIGALCLYVTFIDDFAGFPFAVGLVSLVDSSEPEKRTFKLERRNANGNAYALTIARKHGVLKENILERIRC